MQVACRYSTILFYKSHRMSIFIGDYYTADTARISIVDTERDRSATCHRPAETCDGSLGQSQYRDIESPQRGPGRAPRRPATPRHDMRCTIVHTPVTKSKQYSRPGRAAPRHTSGVTGTAALELEKAGQHMLFGLEHNPIPNQGMYLSVETLKSLPSHSQLVLFISFMQYPMTDLQHFISKLTSPCIFLDSARTQARMNFRYTSRPKHSSSSPPTAIPKAILSRGLPSSQGRVLSQRA